MTISIYGAVLAIIYVFLALYVINARGKYLSAMGDGGHHELQMRIRAHGNFNEYTPLFIVLLGVAEYNGLVTWAVHAFGAVYVLGRLLHAYSLLKHEKYEGDKLTTSVIFRRRGMEITLYSLLILSAVLIIQFVLKVL